MRLRHALGFLLIGSALSAALMPAQARAQAVISGGSAPFRMNDYYAAPGFYGMAYGSMSAGVPRTYTSFASPYGAGYGAGYAPYGLLPGRYGVGLWRPGFVTPGYLYGASYYRTFPVPYSSNAPGGTAPVGLYAPPFGPPSPLSYSMPYMGW
jgi:hypothetical protein